MLFLFRTNLHPRTNSPSLHPCPASGSASGFLPASVPHPTRPCDLPVQKTRDASHRLLPPVRKRSPASRYVPGSLEPLSRLGTLRKSPRLLRCMTEGPGVFTTPETASAPSIRTQCPRAFVLADSSHEHGLVRPTAFDAIEPLTPLSRLPLPLHAHAPSCVDPKAPPYGFGETPTGLQGRAPPRSTSSPSRERRQRWDDLRCLPSTRTLRRIRWRLPPRSRDRCTAFGDEATA